MSVIRGKKEIQRIRTMRYFIDATTEIIESSSLESLSIRKVGDIAGYNSATIYNYFDNLEHLVYYSYFKNIKNLIFYLDYCNEEDYSSERGIRERWIALCRLSFEFPNIIYTLLFSTYSNYYERILHDYIEIYSDEFDDELVTKINSNFGVSLIQNLIKSINGFCKDENLNSENVGELKYFIIAYLQGVLIRQNSFKRLSNYLDYEKMMKEFINRMICAYSKKNSGKYLC